LFVCLFAFPTKTYEDTKLQKVHLIK